MKTKLDYKDKLVLEALYNLSKLEGVRVFLCADRCFSTFGLFTDTEGTSVCTVGFRFGEGIEVGGSIKPSKEWGSSLHLAGYENTSAFNDRERMLSLLKVCATHIVPKTQTRLTLKQHLERYNFYTEVTSEELLARLNSEGVMK